MKTSITEERLSSLLASIEEGRSGPGEMAQPVHTLYGGAHLFTSNATAKLGGIAASSFAAYAPEPSSAAEIFGLDTTLSEAIHAKIGQKLASCAIEDLRVDFEDGYGWRPDEEEDAHAVAAARETAAAMSADGLPEFFGIRVKSLAGAARRRSLRTLDLYLTALAAAGRGLPGNFVVTLPKITDPSQPRALADAIAQLENTLGFDAGSVKMELMVETRRSLLSIDGRFALQDMVDACEGRCRGLHFGAWDYLAEFGVTAEHQHLLHPLCEMARQIMQLTAPDGVWISDGATNIMPIGPHRGEMLSDEQLRENRSVVHEAWRLHYRHCRAALSNGIRQGWDLHPSQIPARLAAVYSFFLTNISETGARLRRFIDKAAQATLARDVFDDEATGRGLLNHFVRAVNCGALTEAEAEELAGVPMDLLAEGSFAKIVDHRKSN